MSSDSYYSKIGIAMAKLRKDSNISIEELSKKTNIPTERIESFEQGNCDLPLLDFMRLCKALNADPDSLIKQQKTSHS